MKHHFHGRFTQDLDGVDPLSLEVFRAFKTAMLRQSQLMFRMMANKGTHPAQAGCLRMLIEQDGITQRDLAENMHVSRPTITTMLQKMEKSGLIERRADERDQRLTRIYLTDSGRELSGLVGSAFRELVEVSFGSMPEADRRELLRLLTDMNVRLGGVLSDGSVADGLGPAARPADSDPAHALDDERETSPA